MDSAVMIITGASRGLGAATARAAARQGAQLVLNARSAAQLKGIAARIEAPGGVALVVPGDIGREEDCQAVIQAALERFGRIDAVVNNAGVIEPIARIDQADSQAWRQNWAVNFLGPLMLTRLALPELRQRGGRVINISSGTASAVIQGWGAYSTAKAALEHFTRIMAAEEPQITALVFRPGIVDTEMQATIRATGKTGMSESDYNRLSGLHQQGRLIPASAPGQAIAALALRAPHAWSGETLQWDEERVQAFVKGEILL